MNDKYVSNAGIRVKGSGTRPQNLEGRIPLRVDFDQGKFHGVKRISLNSNVYDSSCMREVLSYELFRQFKVPAPRCAYANVYVTVPGLFTNRYLGFYTLVEAVDKRFLKNWFEGEGGLLMKPNLGQSGFPSGKSWQAVVRQMQPKTLAAEKQKERMLKFFKFVTEADDDTFQKEIESYVEIDNYLRFLVVNVALANLDSYLGMGKNYYIYLDPKTDKLNWIPWDLDLSFGGFFLAGTSAERMNLSIDNPSSINDPLIRKILGIPAMRKKYHEAMREFLAAGFDPVKINGKCDAFREVVNLALEGSPPGSGAATPDIQTFMAKRVRSIQEQLEGKSNGDRPSFFH